MIKFDFDQECHGKVCDVHETIGFCPELSIPADPNRYILIQRWTVSYQNANNRKEIISYLGEVESEISPKSKFHDRALLTDHLRSSFLNVQMYLHENIPGNYRTSKRDKNDFEGFADQTLHHIELAGLYV